MEEHRCQCKLHQKYHLQEMITDVNRQLIPKQKIRMKLRILRIILTRKTKCPHDIAKITDIPDFIDNDTCKIKVGCPRRKNPNICTKTAEDHGSIARRAHYPRSRVCVLVCGV